MGVLDQLKNFWDDSLSDDSNAYDLYSTSIQAAMEYDAQGPQTVFTAIVLTDPFPLDPNQASIFFDSSTAQAASSPGFFEKLKGTFGLDESDPTPPTVISKFIFKARIDGANSPHSFLPDPCSETYANKPEKAREITALHTTFISTEDYISGEGSKLPKQGDLVNVRLSQNLFGYNLYYGQFLNLVDTSLITPKQSEAQKSCQTLFQNFDPNDVAWVGRAGAGGTGPYARVGLPGTSRTIDFSRIKHAASAACKPANAASTDVKKYFGEALWNKYVAALAAHEGSWSSNNPAGYTGRYQFSVELMIKYGFIKASAGKKWNCDGCQSVTQGTAVKAMYNDPNSWTKFMGISSQEDWYKSQDAQNEALYKFSSSNLSYLNGKNAVDMDNPKDVAGMLGMSHLKGAGGAVKVRKQGKDRADGKLGTTKPGGMFPSTYYVEIGNIC